MTIDRRLRSGSAPWGLMLTVWLVGSAYLLALSLAGTMSTTLAAAPSASLSAAGATILGVAGLGLAIASLGHTAWRLLGRESCAATCVLLALNPLLLAAFLPQAQAQIAWPIVLTGCAVLGLAQRDVAPGAALAGAAMGLGCTLEASIWPLGCAFAALLSIRWLRDGGDPAPLLAYVRGAAAATAAVAAFRFVLDGFAGTQAGAGDIWSAPVAMALVLAGTTLLARLPRPTPALLACGLAATTLAGGAAMLLLSSGPVPAHAAWGTGWWLRRAGAGTTLLYTLPALLALGASGYLWRSNQAWLRRWWGEYAAVLLVAVLAGTVVPVLAPTAAFLATMPLGWLGAQLLFGRRRGSVPKARAIAAAAIVTLASGALAATGASPGVSASGPPQLASAR